MKSIFPLNVLCILSLLSLPTAAAPPPGHPPVSQGNLQTTAQASLLTQKAKVKTVVNVRNYTYLEVVMDQSVDKTPIWLAGPSTRVEVGDTVRFDQGMQMKDFRSESLNRTFADILFVSYIEASQE